MLTDSQAIEFLSSKKSFKQFQEFALSDPFVSKIDVIAYFRKKEVWVSLTDGTALHFMFYHDVISHGLSLISIKEFHQHSTTNEFGILVPSRKQQYEYLVLQVQFNGVPMADRFRNIFSGLDDLSRRELFQHIQPKYDLVLSVIEELYEPLGQFRYRMMVGLRHERRNSLLGLAIRVISQGIFNLFRLFTPKTRVLIPDPGQQQQQTVSAPKLRTY